MTIPARIVCAVTNSETERQNGENTLARLAALYPGALARATALNSRFDLAVQRPEIAGLNLSRADAGESSESTLQQSVVGLLVVNPERSEVTPKKKKFCGADCGCADHLIAMFGEAQLVRDTSGQYELRGGNASDHTSAMEWISLFLHEAVVTPPPARMPAP